MYANPRSGEVDSESIKRYDSDRDLDAMIAANPGRIAKESRQVRDYRDSRAFLASRFENRGTLLEVGCSLGYLLDYFRQDGWVPFGIEPHSGLCKYARKVLGIEVFQGLLDEADIPPHSIDVVTMMHVIEHVPDPKAVLLDVFRILKPGGFFIVETPRYDTFMFKLMGRRERSVSCDGHIYFFTKRTLSAMAQAAGFEVVKADCVGRSVTASRLLDNIGIMSKSEGVQRGLHQLRGDVRRRALPHVTPGDRRQTGE